MATQWITIVLELMRKLEKCLVTDVRLKRTIRDYLMLKGYNGEQDKNKDIFIRDEGGSPVTGNQRSKSYKSKEEFFG